MKNLYMINNELQMILDNLEVDETTGEVLGYEELDRLNMDAEDIITGTAVDVKNKSEEIEALSKEIKNLNMRKNKLERIVESHKRQIYRGLKLLGKNKITSPRAEIKTRKSSYVNITDDMMIDIEYLIPQPLKVDRKAIKDALKQGREVKGAELCERENIIIG